MKEKETVWFRLKIATAHILGGANCDQPYDFTNACSACGTGAIALPPLIADLSAMGKKDLDVTAYDGHIIVTRRIADAISNSPLTGVSFAPVRYRTKSEPDQRFAWLRVQSQWPPMHQKSVFEIDDACPRCHRAGHCDSRTPPTAIWYESAPRRSSDFNRTWEYWGVWSLASPKVGGAQLPILSARAKQFLTDLKIKHLRFDPIHFVESEGV
jgi:hypothetical protein